MLLNDTDKDDGALLGQGECQTLLFANLNQNPRRSPKSTPIDVCLRCLFMVI